MTNKLPADKPQTKSIKLAPDLHQKLKMRAVREKKELMKLVDELLRQQV